MVTEFLSILKSACPGRTVNFRPAEVVFRQDSVIRWFSLVTDGRVRLVRVLASGAEVSLATVVSGAVVAEASLFASRYHCQAIAAVPTTVIRFPVGDVRSMLERKPQAAISYGAYLARQLIELRNLMEIRSVRRADERCIMWLLLNAQGSPPSVEEHRSWRDVATEIGLTPESMYRALARLTVKGIIQRMGRKITLLM